MESINYFNSATGVPTQNISVAMDGHQELFNSTNGDMVTLGDNFTSNQTETSHPCDSVCAFPIFDAVVNLGLAGSLCILGLFGNTLSILVLQKERTNRVAVLLLQALAVADNACLIVSFAAVSVFMGIVTSLPDCGLSLHSSRIYVEVYLTPLGYMSQTATIWMTVLLAANRYIAICRPFQAQNCLTLKRAKIQVAAVALFSVFFNLPRIFQFHIFYNESGSLDLKENPSIGPSTTFGKVYTNGLYSVLVLLIPFVTLVIMNTKLIREFRASQQRMRRNSLSPPEQQDENITFIMIIIIIVFLVCHLPDRIMQIVSAILKDRAVPRCAYGVYIAQCFCNLLFIVNSSVNFLIYYVFRKRFRKILKTKICGWIGKSSTDEYSMDSQGGMERVHLNSVRNTEVYVANGNGLTKLEENESELVKNRDKETTA